MTLQAVEETSTITRNVVISSSRLDTIESCFQKAHLRYNLKLYPLFKPDYFERGTLIALMCEEFYKSKLKGEDFNTSLNTAIEIGRIYSVKAKLDISKCEAIIERFIQYLHFYLDDSWEIVGVEEPFTKIIYESEEHNVRLIAEGKLDLLVRHARELLIVDTKSTAKEADYRKIQAQKLNNQFALYCLVFNVNTICINDIGVQKGKDPTKLFNRRLINFPQENLNEWLNDTVYWVINWLEHVEADFFPRNRSSCYGCEYNKVCSETPSMRNFIVNRDFEVKEGDFNIYTGR